MSNLSEISDYRRYGIYIAEELTRYLGATVTLDTIPTKASQYYWFKVEINTHNISDPLLEPLTVVISKEFYFKASAGYLFSIDMDSLEQLLNRLRASVEALVIRGVDE